MMMTGNDRQRERFNFGDRDVVRSAVIPGTNQLKQLKLFLPP